MIISALVSQVEDTPGIIFGMIPASHLHSFQIASPCSWSSCLPRPREGGPPGKASEICGAGHAPLSSDPLGVRWPSRPAGHTPPASGSAAWPSACPRANQTCDTRRSCSGQSSGNKPRGSPGEPLCPFGFHQLGSRWSCHLLLWQKAVLGGMARSTNLCLCSIKFCSPTFSPGQSTRTQLCSGVGGEVGNGR